MLYDGVKGSCENWLIGSGWSRESSSQFTDHIYVKLALAGLTPWSLKEMLRNVTMLSMKLSHRVEKFSMYFITKS